MRMIVCLLTLSLLMAPVCFAGELSDNDVNRFWVGGTMAGIAKGLSFGSGATWVIGAGILGYELCTNNFAPVEKGSKKATEVQTRTWLGIAGATLVFLL